MRILVCPDSFKGTMSSAEAAKAIAKGILKEVPGCEVEIVPLGDGGEGTVDAVGSAIPGVERVWCDTVDPLRRPVRASYGILGGKTALIETAAASGLTLVEPGLRDVMKADSFGTGLLVADAIGRGIRDFIICMGGSATCDAGYGAWEAIPHPAPTVSMTLLCDVDNPLCGPTGAAAVFAPQKGATPEMIPRLEAILEERARLYENISGIDVRYMKYAGAAGGIAGMFMALFGATPVNGIRKVLEIVDFDSKLQDADLVITGEGCADATTLRGKAASGILEAARKRGVPVALLAGKVTDRPLLLKAGFNHILQATPEDASPDVSPAEYLSLAASRLLRETFLNKN